MNDFKKLKARHANKKIRVNSEQSTVNSRYVVLVRKTTGDTGKITRWLRIGAIAPEPVHGLPIAVDC